MTDNEKLIEEARRLPDQFRAAQLSETQYLEDQALAELDAVGYGAVCTASRLADALEAAEKVHTPTDDERIWAEYRDAAPENNTPDQRRAFFAALRRSEVPEPSTEDWDNRDDEVNGETRGFLSCGRCAWSMSRGLFADLHEHERTHDSEPQGEPSDAQRIEARTVFRNDPDSDGMTLGEAFSAGWRAALRAASTVTESGSAEKPRCGGGLTHCRHDQWPPMHSMACPISKAAVTEQGENR